MKILSIIYKILPALLLCGLLHPAAAQNLSGTVVSADGDTLIGATVQWQDSGAGTVTDARGYFELPRRPDTAILKITYVGYEPVTVEIFPAETQVLIQVAGIIALDAVDITGRKRSNYTSTLDPRGVQNITAKELRKAPCCNLSESFETSGSVDVVYTDAVTGAKEIRMLGLRGLYSQMMVESRPDLNGLATPFALEYIPGTWISGIMINKGAGSVINGYQSITGQINMDIVKPDSDKRIFLNLYGEPTGRGEFNLHLNKSLTNKWFTGLLLHGDILEKQEDHNGDGFLDMPLKRQLNGLYRIFYESEAVCTQLNVHGITERRDGGQLIPASESPAGYFRTTQRTDRLELFGKTGYKGFADVYKNLGSQYSLLYHRTNAVYGGHRLEATERQAYLNLLYTTIIRTTDHKVTTGASFHYDDIRQALDDADYSYREAVPGAFAEYSYDRHSPEGYPDFNLIAGLRLDYFNLDRLLVTPRLNLKYNFDENAALRLGIGRGYRTANVFVENTGLLANNKTFVVAGDLEMETAWNAGLNFTRNFTLKGREGQLNADLYRTEFQDQVVIDVDQDLTKVLIYNLDGRSYANSFLVTVDWEILKNLELKLGYKFNDVWVTYTEGLRNPPLVSKQRGLATLYYETPAKKWRFNVTSQWVGPQRLPDHDQLPHEYSHDLDQVSPAYALLNAQVNRTFKTFEVYAGGENLTNYVQHHPIIAAEDPWSQYFDASQVYAPMSKMRVYVGVKWWLD